MGIQGLETFLKERGLLPTFDKETESMHSFTTSPTIIPKGSTFAMDGNGLAYYLFQNVYFDHYKKCMMHKERYENDVHLIMALLPSMISLRDLNLQVKEFVSLIRNRFGIHMHVYFDGRKNFSMSRNLQRESEEPELENQQEEILVFKDQTCAQRDASRMEKEFALSRFFRKQILPRSFSSKRSSSGETTFEVPDAHTFLHEFPKPNLLMEEVYFTLLELSKQDHDDLTELKIIDCESEADRDVALESAMDRSNQTYAVGQDSDYVVFGFAKDDLRHYSDESQVQYLPLESLCFDNNEVSGYVLTRAKLAQELNLDEYMILEATILRGNDYTKFVSDRKERKRLNFYKEYFQDEKALPPFADIAEVLSEIGDYRVQSDDEEQQEYIEFSRKLFGFQDMNNYLEHEIDEEYESNLDTSSVDDRIEDNLAYAFGETLIHEAESYFENDVLDSDFCIKSRVMASFDDQINLNEDVRNLLQDALDLMAKQPKTDDDHYVSAHTIIPKHLSWNEFMLAEIAQNSIAKILHRKDLENEETSNPIPSSIFCHHIFYNALLKKTEVEFQVQEELESKDGEQEIAEPSSHERKVLPIDEHKEDILKSIEENRVTIIQGETGCGKSSRVPLMIMEAPPPDPSLKKVKMFICQPRRIAAKSLTERIRSTEPKLKKYFGLRMGHGVREYETKDTRAWFVTTGYLVRFLANNMETFNDVTHLVIDEVHERAIDSDVLCLLTKRLLQFNPRIRVILMSATVAADIYKEYFGVSQIPIFVGVRTYNINEYYLEDIANRFNFSKKEKKVLSTIKEKCDKSKCKHSPDMKYMECLYQLTLQLVLEVGKKGTSVLVFVPGMSDIVQITEAFDSIVSKVHYKIIPIHSDIPFEDQMEVFDAASKEEVKVVLATNAAESSITLPDVNTVICFGLCKAISYNENSHRQILETQWISKANAKQRSGRTGRVREGSVYRLYPKSAFESHFQPFEEGEMLRSPLDSVILNLRTIIAKEDSVTQMLKECIQAPDLKQIENSYASLYNRFLISEPSDHFDVTALGSFVSALGIDHAIASMVGVGAILGLLPETIDMAAILSFPKSPWLLSNAILQEPEIFNEISSKTFVSISKFDGGLFSELFSIMNLLFKFERAKDRHSFCRKNSVSFPRISRLLSIRNNLVARVAAYMRLDAKYCRASESPSNMDTSKLLALRVIKVWMFSEGTIKLPTPKQNVKDAMYSTLHLVGDIIADHHLEQILDPVRHPYHLRTESNLTFQAHFKPVQMDDLDPKLDIDAFHERLLSFSIEKQNDVVVSRLGNSLYIFTEASKATEAMEAILTSSQCSLNGKVMLVPSTSRNSTSANLWIYGTEQKMHRDDKSVIFYIYEYKGKKRKNVQNKLRTLENEFKYGKTLDEISSLYIDISNDQGGKVHISCHRCNIENISKMEMTALFRSPNVSIKKSDSSTMMQVIKFKDINLDKGRLDLVGGSEPVIERIRPEGARLCLSVAASRRIDKSLIFYKDSKSGPTEYLKVKLKEKFPYDQWKWTETGESAILNSENILSSTSKQNRDVYAVCGNILELKGGKVRAEGMTLVPSEEFIELSKRCIYRGYKEKRGEDTDIFREYFYELLAKEEIRFSHEAKALLCQAFEDFDMVPWENSIGTLSLENRVEKRNQSRKKEKSSSNDRMQIGVKKPLQDIQPKKKSRKKKGKTSNIQEKQTVEQDCRYQCILCTGAKNMKWPKLLQHLSTSHSYSKVQVRKLKKEEWTEVDSSSTDEKSSNEHQNAASNESKDKKITKVKQKYRCVICQAGPFKWKSMKAHVTSTHQNEESSLPEMKQHLWLDEISNYRDQISQSNETNEISGMANTQPTSPIPLGSPSTKSKAKYRCRVCNEGPFKWKAMIEHVSTIHRGHPSLLEMKPKKWLDSSVGNATPKPVASTPTKNSTSNTKYHCFLCNAGPFKWKAMRKHVISNHKDDKRAPALIQNNWISKGGPSNSIKFSLSNTISMGATAAATSPSESGNSNRESEGRSLILSEGDISNDFATLCTIAEKKEETIIGVETSSKGNIEMKPCIEMKEIDGRKSKPKNESEANGKHEPTGHRAISPTVANTRSGLVIGNRSTETMEEDNALSAQQSKGPPTQNESSCIIN
ncbi:hypothetical protein CTEN210_09693 [Chaetoceros tenuissimus]|uniref:RNA helicase n=1 Tax=Chaetoceros tenuissimus TaxID=426638 RepID=A0AAD3CVX8_9STRA|nr:hypothetical protein CTEN210_09693 [Chaetoceros tenuissimus]